MDTQRRTDRRVKYTKQAIRNSFLNLLSEKPMDKISVTEICRDADINRGTFYSHYTDPYELKTRLEAELAAAMEERMRDLGVKRLSSLQTFELLKENQDLCRIFVGPHGDREAMLRMVKRNASAYLEQKSELLSGLSNYERLCVSEMLVSAISAVVKYWFDTGMQEPPEQIAAVLDTFCSCGLYGFSHRLAASDPH